MTHERGDVTQEKRRGHEVHAPEKKVPLGALCVPAVNAPYCTISVTASLCAGPPAAVAVTVTCDVPSAVGAATVTNADPAAPPAAVAVTVTVAGFGTTAGGVYMPVPSTVPFALPPVTAQVTLWLAVNCC